MKNIKSFTTLLSFFFIVMISVSCRDNVRNDDEFAENQKLVDTKWVLKNWDYSLGEDYIGLHDETYNFFFYSLNEGVFYYGKKDKYSDLGSSNYRVVCHFKYKVVGDNIYLQYLTDNFLSTTQLTLNDNILTAGNFEFTKNTISYNDMQFLNSVQGDTGACSWYSDMNGKLWVIGEGAMANYSSYSATPWAKNNRTPNYVIVCEGVTTIGSHAFANESIVDIEMPDKSLLEVGDAAFKGSLIKSIWMSQSTVVIGNEAFAYCEKLKDINIPEGIVSVGEYAFSGTAINELNLNFGANTRIIGKFAFEGGKASYLTFAEGVQEISTGAFLGEYCGISKELVLPNSLLSLGATAFEGMFNKIVVGNGLVEIGDKAFVSSVSSGSMYVNLSVPPTTGDNIIVDRTNWGSAESNWTLYVPKGCKSKYSGKTPWNKFKSIVEDASLEGDGSVVPDEEEGENGGGAYDENGEYSDLLQDELDAANPLRGNVADGFSRGSGTSSDPYIISSAAELRYLSDAVRAGNVFKNKYIKLETDITINRNVLNSDGELNGDGSDFEPWIPIGRLNPSYFFCGTFDGAGHTISGLYCNRPEGENVGFFGKFYGNVKNLTITDSYFCGKKYVGGIAGTTDISYIGSTIPTSLWEYYRTYPDLSITSCVNGATVIAEYGIGGGIVGQFHNGKAYKCLNQGRVVGGSGIGGIAGSCWDEIISCCNKGNIVAKDVNCGGIVGEFSGGIYNCMNRGSVKASDRIAGIGGCGLSNGVNIINNVNIATDIVGGNSDTTGAIGGSFSKEVTIKYNYYLFVNGLRSVGKSNASGSIITGNKSMTESEMKSAGFISTLNSNAKSSWGKWKTGSDGYPVLEWME